MRTNFNQLKGVEVYTQSGVYLGKVRDLVIDIDNHSVIQYLVKKFPLWIPESDKFLVHATQIESFKEDVIVVSDARLKEETQKTKQNTKPDSVIMSDSES